ncbi:MAG: 3-phosphoshikimate 1-carboxyvinyltransferase [SAR202 cluster bacterium]|nr:3-phosphoshikimate 1-carboxyvinyltransferase [SAR202 cluster bacterium]
MKKHDRIEGTIRPPGDKSISHRAALLNAVANGNARVSNFCVGDDRESMLRCLQGLGVQITPDPQCDVSGQPDCFLIQGRGLQGLLEPTNTLDAGNSGTTMRLVTGLLAGQSFISVITGDDSLRRRPMGRVVGPLKEMGAQFMGREGDSLAPLAVRGGNLKAIDYTLPVPSAQVKSAVLIAGLYADGKTVVRSPSLSRDHTERMLKYLGGDIQVDGLVATVGRSEFNARDILVPGDVSSAAFWMVAGSAHPNAKIRLEGVGINPTRTGVISVLESMGANLSLENIREGEAEPIADIVVESSNLQGVDIAGEIIPKVIDELPVLALAASLASGSTVIRDAAELRVKESDRISATVQGLSRLGVDIEEHEEGMVIRGAQKLVGAPVNSQGDHRIAMTMAIAGLIADGETAIHDAEAAAVSYPTFWDTLASIGV